MTRTSGWRVVGGLGVFGMCVGFLSVVRRPAAAPSVDEPLTEVHRTNLVQDAAGWGWPGRSNRFSGLLVDTYPDGVLKSRSVVSNGLLQGLSQGWHTNGILQVEETYEAGVSHGLRSKWYPDGRLLSEAPIDRGRLQGVFQHWDEQGNLVEEIELQAGQPDGLSRSYHPDGSIRTEVRMRVGQVVETRSWETGQRVGPTLAPPQGHRRAAGITAAVGHDGR